MEEGISVISNIQNTRIEFYPSSDTYFIPEKEKYGVGIEELCERILRWRFRQESKIH
jgi:hypothetical protein